jgi:hypothetical protein
MKGTVMETFENTMKMKKEGRYVILFDWFEN